MSKEDTVSHTWESLIDRKRANFFRDYLPCRSLAEWPFFIYDLKKLFAASLEARFLVAASCKRSISDFKSVIRSVSSSTESSERSWPISWLIFFLGRSSSSMGIRVAPD